MAMRVASLRRRIFRFSWGVVRAAQPPIRLVPGALSLGVKRPVCEADYSPPSSVDVKNGWSYTSTPQYVFMAWCLIKHRDNFTFYTETMEAAQMTFYKLCWVLLSYITKEMQKPRKM
jgi:hypothetical protein